MIFAIFSGVYTVLFFFIRRVPYSTDEYFEACAHQIGFHYRKRAYDLADEIRNSSYSDEDLSDDDLVDDDEPINDEEPIKVVTLKEMMDSSGYMSFFYETNRIFKDSAIVTENVFSIQNGDYAMFFGNLKGPFVNRSVCYIFDRNFDYPGFILHSKGMISRIFGFLRNGRWENFAFSGCDESVLSVFFQSFRLEQEMVRLTGGITIHANSQCVLIKCNTLFSVETFGTFFRFWNDTHRYLRMS